MDLQELRVRIRVHVAAGFPVEELEEFSAIHEVSIDAHGQSKGTVDEEWLRFRPGPTLSV